MKTTKIDSVEYRGENIKGGRQLKIRLSNGNVITAEACHESWEQWGGGVDDLRLTMPIVEAHNEWLHGGERPDFN